MTALHVVHLIEALGPGGAERLLYTNLKHFDPARVLRNHVEQDHVLESKAARKSTWPMFAFNRLQ